MTILRLLVASALASALAACGGSDGKSDGGNGNGQPGPVATVSISPTSLALEIGGSAQLTAQARDASGRDVLTASVVWSADDDTVATISATGNVLAIGVGRTPVRATVGSIHTSINVDVSAIPPAIVTSVEIDPPSAVIEEGNSVQFFATARDESGAVITGRGEHWTSGDSSVAFVEPLGLTTGLRPGTTTVNVEVEGRTASASIRVEADYAFSLLYSTSLPLSAPALYTIDLNDAGAVPIPVFSPTRAASDPTPSPDGAALAFVVVSGSDTHIYRANRDGTGARQLTVGTGLRDQPAWSPDGSRIAYRERTPGLGTDIWTMDATDGSAPMNLTADMGSTSQSWPAWSWVPIGGTLRIAFSHSDVGQGHIWTMGADGGDKRQLTFSTVAYDDQPAWSPDGSRIVFQRSAPGIFGNIFWVDANVGGAGAALMPTLISLGGPHFAPTFSPDGRLVAFAGRDSNGDYQIFTVWANGTRVAQRTFAAEQHADPAWIID